MAVGDKLYIADKATLDTVNRNVSDVHSRVGTTTDGGGSTTGGTLFAKLNALISSIAAHVANWTAARAAKIDNIDTNATSAASNAAAASAQTAANHTPSATGTLSQKLSKVIADLAGINANVSASARLLSAKKASANIPARATVTVVNISGPGVLHAGYVGHNSANITITVTVDGVPHVVNNSTGGTFARTFYSGNMFTNVGNGAPIAPVEFSRSLIVTAVSKMDEAITCICDYAVYE